MMSADFGRHVAVTLGQLLLALVEPPEWDLP